MPKPQIFHCHWLIQNKIALLLLQRTFPEHLFQHGWQTRKCVYTLHLHTCKPPAPLPHSLSPKVAPLGQISCLWQKSGQSYRKCSGVFFGAPIYKWQNQWDPFSETALSLRWPKSENSELCISSNLINAIKLWSEISIFFSPIYRHLQLCLGVSQGAFNAMILSLPLTPALLSTRQVRQSCPTLAYSCRNMSEI